MSVLQSTICTSPQESHQSSHCIQKEPSSASTRSLSRMYGYSFQIGDLSDHLPVHSFLPQGFRQRISLKYSLLSALVPMVRT